MTKASEREREEARQHLLKHLKPGQTVYTVLRHVSRSGMSREISVVTKGEQGMLNHDYHAAKLLGWNVGPHGGIKVGGCGMDMGFHLVYQLGYSLWPNGTDEVHGTRNGEPDTNGGYALKQQWL